MKTAQRQVQDDFYNLLTIYIVGNQNLYYRHRAIPGSLITYHWQTVRADHVFNLQEFEYSSAPKRTTIVEDLPPICWIRFTDCASNHLIIERNALDQTIRTGAGGVYHLSSLSAHMYSSDLKTWTPFTS